MLQRGRAHFQILLYTVRVAGHLVLCWLSLLQLLLSIAYKYTLIESTITSNYSPSRGAISQQ